MASSIALRRRDVLRGAVAGATLSMLGSPVLARAAEETYKWVLADVTPSTVAGPFYPLVNKPVDRDADLSVIGAGSARAKGQILYLMGQVFNIKGTVSTMASPRQTRSSPIAWPCCTGAGIGPK